MNQETEQEKALDEFIESGALATNMCPDFLRDAYFNYGFDAGVMAERKRLRKIFERQILAGVVNFGEFFPDQQEQRSEG